MAVNNLIPRYPNMYRSINTQDQHFSHMLSNQIAPSVQALMLPSLAGKNNYGLSDYSMTSGEEDIMNNEVETDKHPWQCIENKRKIRKRYNATYVNTEEPSTSNRYQPLEKLSDKNDEKAESRLQIKKPSPPPIYIYGVTDFKAMTETLLQIVVEQYYTRRTTENTVKIIVKKLNLTGINPPPQGRRHCLPYISTERRPSLSDSNQRTSSFYTNRRDQRRTCLERS
jgi:hypothetical protein